ncbi:MAG: glutamine-hydrolyzing GMP synthase, partial [Firmicutes bacterium]|nr:glutamine-hydrolyzing GMP synthase [Bacillota bacterium]
DCVSSLPDGFVGTASTAGCPVAACENPDRKLYGVQFHPNAEATEQGREILQNFFFNICHASGDYHLGDYVDREIAKIRDQVGNERVLLALSGGVDSSVCAAILSRAIPGQTVCIFVDHGFMRLNEADEVEAAFAGRDLQFIRVNAQERFLGRLKGVTDPERKRKLVGEEFIRVFEEEAGKLGDIKFLGQGTIYPDVIESGGKHGDTVKSHHNVGGLPENLKFAELVEPLYTLFKNEVREIGRLLGLPASLTERQPFPGPGLSVRVMGEVTKEKLDVLREADRIVLEEFAKLRDRPQQYFAIYTGARSTGVRDGRRTYGCVIAVRAVATADFMTAKAAEIPYETLRRVSSRIAGEVEGVGRVVYDITDKPPGTVEWE